MRITAPLRLEPVALWLTVAILIAWCLSALVLEQPLMASQKSRLLMELGAANGDIIGTHEWWRILSSQFLHVHFLHMLFNATCILIIGSFIESRHGWPVLLPLYVVGGCIGQAASVLSYPDLVSSGASQALMALCGAALVTVSRRYPRMFVVIVAGIQVALDLYLAHGIKAGHGVGFIAGLLMGAIVLMLGRSRATHSEPKKSMQPTCEDARG